MKKEYKLREITPKEMLCGIGTCPAIYEVERITSKEMQCAIGACPEIYQDSEDNYFVIGTQINPEDAGLENKVGEGEVLIKVPKALIDNCEK